MASTSLPIWEIHAPVLESLRDHGRLVLVAPTGSGKTTQVPQMLLDGGFASGGRIIVLQPRRVAARTVAARVAEERGCKLGTEVGYQVRFDDSIGDATRIGFVTEGILLRWLQDDPQLRDVAVLVFDEFHERNLLSDVALALAKKLQAGERPDLKLVVMSATLDAEPVAAYLGDAPLLRSEGISHPVEVRLLEHGDRRPASDQAADAVEQIVNSDEPGDVLVFMPGMAEINSTVNALRAARMSESVEFIPLHGDLPPEQQDLAFRRCDRRKIVIATNVAETSITIDGIRHVVDSGLARVARYDAERGIQTLMVENISRASAEQRKGRAGRTAPGTCWRLWTEGSHLDRPERNTPEIQRADLAEVVLLLHSLGIREAAKFDWLDKPDAQAVERAERLLVTLGAIDPASGHLSELGRRMMRLPMHPRYSRMLVEAAARNCVRAASLCAALVSGRDLLMRVPRGDDRAREARELFEASAESDFFTLMRAYEFARKNNFGVETCRRYGIHAQTARQVQQTFEQFLQLAERERLLDPNEAPPADESLQRCILAGFADQLTARRDTGSLECELTEGRVGTLMRESVVHNSPLFVTASIREVEGVLKPLTLLGLATAVKREWIAEMFNPQLDVRLEHLFDRGNKRVAAVRLERFHGLVIHHEHSKELDPEAAGRALADAFSKGWFDLPNLGHAVKQFIARVNLVCVAMPDLEYPRFDEAATDESVARAFHGMSLVKEAQAANLLPAFHAHLEPAQVGWLDELVPTQITWHDGRKLKLVYSEETDPVRGEAVAPEIAVKLIDCFDLTEHPLLCEGAVPVRLALQTPDGKRLDVTGDWPQWKAQVYPKHRAALAKKFPGFTWR